ncbi:hypothetical protein WJX73_002816 [Symbiochloris irregularis]|uniref:Uncharacterized protein n=1 Tax=Symbiochloris irregularis TaxID=706552 RepID=A0AAW1NYU1_9CHLO
MKFLECQQLGGELAHAVQCNLSEQRWPDQSPLNKFLKKFEPIRKPQFGASVAGLQEGTGLHRTSSCDSVSPVLLTRISFAVQQILRSQRPRPQRAREDSLLGVETPQQ